MPELSTVPVTELQAPCSENVPSGQLWHLAVSATLPPALKVLAAHAEHVTPQVSVVQPAQWGKLNWYLSKSAT